MGIQVNLYCHQHKNSCKTKHLYNMPSARELACSFVACRCLKAFSHHKVSQHEVKAPQSAGRVEAGYGGKVCLQFCKGASLTVLTVIGGGGAGGTHPDQPELSCGGWEGTAGAESPCKGCWGGVPCQLSGRCGTELVPRGCEQPMVQAAGMAPPRWYFGLLSPGGRGETAFSLVLSQPSVVRVQLAADHEPGESACEPRGFCLVAELCEGAVLSPVQLER